MGRPPAEHVLPLFEYTHDGGRCAVIGGHVYRGARIPDLRGAYVYVDWCASELQALVQEAGRVLAARPLGVTRRHIGSFGEGPDGELYALDQFAGLFRLDPA
jgi:hypothetical protein